MLMLQKDMMMNILLWYFLLWIGNEWGGQFQMLEYHDNDAPVIEEYEYIPGRIIIIPSQHPHRGLSNEVCLQNVCSL